MTRSMAILFALLALGLAACGDGEATKTSSEGSSAPGAQAQEVPTPTPAPHLPGSITPAPAAERYRLDLGDGVVVAFVEGLSPEFEGKVAYLTHVPLGTQAVLNRDGQVIHRHDGREDGPGQLEAVLADEAAMERIMEGLQSDEDAKPREHVIMWVHSLRFAGITYTARWTASGPGTISILSGLTQEGLGPELYRVAFRGDGYVGLNYHYEDGDSTYLNPGTPVYEVKGYSTEFRLAALRDSEVILFEADTNSAAKTGQDLLDIRGKVTAIDILSTKDGRAVLATIDEDRSVERFVESVLESPVDQDRQDREGPRYILNFRLADGTSAVRSLWLESGELSRGIMTDPTVATLVRRALAKEGGTDPTSRVGWGGGTGITLPTPSPNPTNGDASTPIPSIPPPTIFEHVWKADKSLIAPGEPIRITLILKNVWDEPVLFTDFPATMTLFQVDQRIEESIPLTLKSGEGMLGPLGPGEEITVDATVLPSLSTGLQPGRYGLRFDVRITHTPAKPEKGGSRLGMSSDILFVVIPPEGALERTVLVGQVREANGARATLDSIHFSSEETIIAAMATSLAKESAASEPAFVPTPTPAIQPQGTATPVVPSQSAPQSTVGPPPWEGDITKLTAFYRLDGGAWHRLGDHGYRETPDGVHHEWSFGPVSAHVSTFDFAIIPGVRPGRDGVFTYPTGDTTWSWEWTVPLQETENR